MEKIKLISEAFSMQPVAHYVGETIDKKKVAKIELEIISFPINGDPFDYRYYVGRDEEGNKMFQFRAETVNVLYFNP